jgi:hypothetical protein
MQANGLKHVSDSDDDDENDEGSHCSSSSEMEAEDEQLLAMLSKTLSRGVANVLSRPISTGDSQAAPIETVIVRSFVVPGGNEFYAGLGTSESE